MVERSKGDGKWHKVGFRTFNRKLPDMYDALIFGSGRWSIWAWIVWRSGGSTSGVAYSLEEARKHANGIVTNLENSSESQR